MGAATVGIIISLFGLFIPIIVSLVIYYRQKNKKEIVYSVLALPLLNVREEIKDKVKILFNETPANNTYLVVIRVWNSGNVPILPNEFVDPITFNLGDDVKVLDASVLEARPEAIKNKVNFEVNSSNLIIKPILLNKDYSIEIKLLVDNFASEIKADALIAGVDHIQRIGSSDPNRIFRFYRFAKVSLGILIFLFTLMQIPLLSFASYTSSPFEPYYANPTFPIILTSPLIILFLLIYYLFTSYVEYRAKKRREQKYIKLLS